MQGDGYTKDQKELFFDDMKRLVQEMWGGDTFSTWLPLFNMWGLFRPSNEQGIGVNGKMKVYHLKILKSILSITLYFLGVSFCRNFPH